MTFFNFWLNFLFSSKKSSRINDFWFATLGKRETQKEYQPEMMLMDHLKKKFIADVSFHNESLRMLRSHVTHIIGCVQSVFFTQIEKVRKTDKLLDQWQCHLVLCEGMGTRCNLSSSFKMCADFCLNFLSLFYFSFFWNWLFGRVWIPKKVSSIYEL